LHPRIVNVHVKDRLRGGGTVPLGDGAAQLGAVFELLRRAGYAGDYILQTARAADGDHAGALARYRDLVAHLVEA
jgi:hexulose-6-phosphate isomerase